MTMRKHILAALAGAALTMGPGLMAQAEDALERVMAAGVLKVGLEAFVRWGPRAVERALEGGSDIFLDLKLHDIPNTVAGAAASAARLGVRYLTVHASGGPSMLRAAVDATEGRCGILAVTVLTHTERRSIPSLPVGGCRRLLHPPAEAFWRTRRAKFFRQSLCW